MKTIEQLADEYVGHPEEIDEFSSATIKRQAFIDGAKAQKKIDIDKACECFCKTCAGQCKDTSHCDTLQKFRNELNAMEE